MNKDLMFSSASSEWATPPEIFEPLNKEFGFTLDVCATRENAKCKRYFSKEDDTFKQDWKGRCWMNPVYGIPENPCPKDRSKCKKKKCIKRGYHIDTYIPGALDFVEKAYWEVLRGYSECVVCLLPVRSDTVWWHRRVMYAAEIRFIEGRITFVGAPAPAPFPSVIVVFKLGGEETKFSSWDYRLR